MQSNKQNLQSQDDRVVYREIYRQLLNHFIEKITGLPCYYPHKIGLKTYKGPTCFASNMKLFFPIILELITKSDIAPETWYAFNYQIRKLIKHEMIKNHYSFDSTHSSNELTYKLITLLLRWREMNRYLPQSLTERRGKAEVFTYLLEKTKTRLGSEIFFSKR